MKLLSILSIAILTASLPLESHELIDFPGIVVHYLPKKWTNPLSEGQKNLLGNALGGALVTGAALGSMAITPSFQRQKLPKPKN